MSYLLLQGGGYFAAESVATLPEWVATLRRNQWLLCNGIRSLTQPSLDMYYFTSYFDYIVLPSKIGVGAGYRKGQMAVGIGYDLIEEINDRQSMVMEDDYPNSYQSTMKAGMEYGLFKGHLPLRMGINYSFAHDHPNTSGLLNKSIGLGLKLGGFRFDGAFIFEYDKRNNTDAVGGNFSLGWVFY